ncbi:MAG TPA: nucleoside 2-deoxyribosyltransferase [Pyrinomonadaceae bacterium]|jgi:8-oxo-dGTP diphosphatase|nr:nucleoside 2-deoxyribosyltransferase [Pyrinomonadaceae bacterium]
MSHVYICSPHRLEKENRAISDALTQLGNTVYLPADLCSSEDEVGDSKTIRRKCIEAIESADAVLCFLDDYGMDCAWELGYAEKAKKKIIGLSLDHYRLNSARISKPQSVDDYWMHGWQEHVTIAGFEPLHSRIRSKTVYLSIPVRRKEAILQIQEALEPYADKLHTPLTIMNCDLLSTARESWHVARHNCIEAIEQSQIVIVYVDDYGMDSAWELGYAERAGKEILGLSLDTAERHRMRVLRPQTVWDYWMHGWKEHSIVQGLAMLSDLFDNSKDFKVPVICPIIERHHLGSVQILIQERVKESDKEYYGVIEIPGGKILKNETIAEALKREVKEECGLDVVASESLSRENSYTLHKSKASLFEPFAVAEETGDHPFIGIFVVCRVVGGELRATSEGINQRWVSASELDDLLANKAILPIIAPGLTKYLQHMLEGAVT